MLQCYNNMTMNYELKIYFTPSKKNNYKKKVSKFILHKSIRV